MYIYVCIYIYIYVYIYVYVCVCLCIYMYVWVYVYVCSYICKCVCMYICIYIYVWLNTYILYLSDPFASASCGTRRSNSVSLWSCSVFRPGVTILGSLTIVGGIGSFSGHSLIFS